MKLLSFGKLRFAFAEENTIWPFYAQFFQESYGCLKIHRGDVVLDAGASVGFFSIYAASRCKRVIAVEPGSDSFKVLILNKALNRASNLIAVNRALWSTSGWVNMTGHGTHFMVDSQPNGGQSVPCLSIDNLLDELNCSVNVVKMDVEGAEFVCLDGSYLDSVREILVEAHGDADQLVGVLRKHGFSTRVIEPEHGAILRNIIKHLPSFWRTEISLKFPVVTSSITSMLREHVVLHHRWVNVYGWK